MLSLVGAGSAAVRGEGSGKATPTTLVYAGASDPTFLDPMLDSDGESFRITKQIFEGLVDLKPGSTAVGPKLATSWSIDKSGKVWTFNLRTASSSTTARRSTRRPSASTSTAGTTSRGPFQNAGATFYYQAIFGGFAHNEVSSLSAPLYKSCKAKGSYKAVVTLTRKNGPFLPALSIPVVRDPEPDRAEEVRREPGDDQQRSLLADGHLRVPAPDGHGPVHARELDRQAEGRSEPQRQVLGHEGQAEADRRRADRRQLGARAGAADR